MTTFKQHFIIVPDFWDLLRKLEYSHGFMLKPGGGDGKLNSVKMYLMLCIWTHGNRSLIITVTNLFLFGRFTTNWLLNIACSIIEAFKSQRSAQKSPCPRAASLIACSTEAAITKQKIYFSLSSQKAQRIGRSAGLLKIATENQLSWCLDTEHLVKKKFSAHFYRSIEKKMYFVLKETVIETAKR